MYFHAGAWEQDGRFFAELCFVNSHVIECLLWLKLVIQQIVRFDCDLF